jgi:Holliday junction resolvasome RuvABC DNA-binding subunit
VAANERNDREAADRDFFQRIMRDNVQNFDNLEDALFAGFQQHRRQPRESRDPTPEEIETVTVMGYSPQEADAALRMANFDIS